MRHIAHPPMNLQVPSIGGLLSFVDDASIGTATGEHSPSAVGTPTGAR